MSQLIEDLEPRRLLTAGQLDPTFGQGGATAIQVEAGGSIGSITPLPDGKLLIASSFAGKLNFFRLNGDGSTDQAFGTSGRVEENFDSDGKQVAVDSTGRIAVANDSAIAMFNAGGSPDGSFGANGVVALAMPVSPDIPQGTPHIAFAAGDNLIVADSAQSVPPTEVPSIYLFRLKPDGSVDRSFNTPDGIALAGLGSIDSMAFAGDGEIFVGAHYFTTQLNDNIEEPEIHVSILRTAASGLNNFETVHVGEGLDNLSQRVTSLTTEPDGSVAALVYDFDANSQTYHYSLWKFTGLDGMETSSRRISIPQPWALAFEMGSDADGKLIVTGEDTQALWYAQRYSLSGDVDPYYGKTEDVFDAPTPVARPSIQGPNQFVSGDAAVLPDGAVVFANTRDRIGKPHDLVIAKVEGGAGAPADVKLNAKGTLIFKGTPVADHVGITLRNRDGKLIVRADDYVKSFAPSRVKRIAVFGNDGDDVLTIGPGVRGGYLEGDNGDDTLTGGDNADILFGGPGADLISGGLARDKIFGDDGNDVLNGNGGNDYILGGAGNDDLFGNGNDDTLSGAGGNDRLYGGGGADVLLGGDGSDAAPEDPLDSRDSIETILT